VAISLAQLLPRAEALVVTTPQPAAHEVAVRAGQMARKTNMRLLGVIENMSGDIFGAGGGERLAEELEVPLLGSIPLDPLIRACADEGEPLVWVEPDAHSARAIVRLAEAIAETKREGRGIVKALPVLG
jgi:ATP-binding protein involved in chromosome partitioning